MRAGLQARVCLWFVPPWLTHRHTDRQLLIGCTISSARWTYFNMWTQQFSTAGVKLQSVYRLYNMCDLCRRRRHLTQQIPKRQARQIREQIYRVDRIYTHSRQPFIYLSAQNSNGCSEASSTQLRYIAGPGKRTRACVRQSSLLEQYRSGAVCIDRSLQVVDLVYRRCVCVSVCLECLASSHRTPCRLPLTHTETDRQW